MIIKKIKNWIIKTIKEEIKKEKEKEELKIFSKKVKGIFSGWKIGRYEITSPCKKYELWIPNGRFHFRDSSSNRLMLGLTEKQKDIMWSEYIEYAESFNDKETIDDSKESMENINNYLNKKNVTTKKRV